MKRRQGMDGLGKIERERIKVLASAKRQQIMRVILSQADKASVSPLEISRTLGESLANVSYHVRVLADCQIIELRDTRPVRGSMQHFYSPDPHFMGLPWVPAVLDSFVSDAA
jgi:DNA-binding transcriptional ArsR family regulator